MNRLPYQPEPERRKRSAPPVTDPAAAVAVLALRLRGLQAVTR